MRDLLRVLWWRLTTPLLIGVWTALAVAVLVTVWQAPCSGGWGDCSNAGVTWAYPAFIGAAVIGAVLAGRSRRWPLASPVRGRPLPREVAVTVATTACCGWFALLIAQLVTGARALATVPWHPFNPLLFAVGLAGVLLWSAVGCLVGWKLPLFLSLPSSVLLAYGGLILPAATPDTWLALATPIDDGAFITGVEEPVSLVLLGQTLAFVGMAGMFVLLAGQGQRPRRRGRTRWLACGLVLAVALVLLVSSGPDRRTHPSSGDAPTVITDIPSGT